MSTASEPAARHGWHARLELEFELRERRTRLTHRRHEGPLMVQKPFYPESGEVAHVCILHPPGGVASGDDLLMSVSVGAAAHAVLTTPASGKFYRRAMGGLARAGQRFDVQGGTLEWLPQENIFYPNAAAEIRTVVRLGGAARFIGWELACLGLPAQAATIDAGEVRTNFELWRGETPLLLERLTLDGGMQQARWGMAGHSALGTAICFPAQRSDLDAANTALAARCEGMTVACTLVDEALICRGLAQRADRLRAAFIDLWSAMRPRVLGREAVMPRIWAT